MFNMYDFFRQYKTRLFLGVVLFIGATKVFAGMPSEALLTHRNAYAQNLIAQWEADGVFSNTVRVEVQPHTPGNELKSSMHKTNFDSHGCTVTIIVDEKGAPVMPGLPLLVPHEKAWSFSMVLAHELAHCAHFARGLRFEHPEWTHDLNEAMNIQMVMAKQMFNESRFVDAQMEHVADAMAILYIRHTYGNDPTLDTFVQKYYNLREHWLGVARKHIGPRAHIPHATQKAIEWARNVNMSNLNTPSAWLAESTNAGSQTAYLTSKEQYAWGGLGALVCALSDSDDQWARSASYAVARIYAGDIAFLAPAPWRTMALHTQGTAVYGPENEKLFKNIASSQRQQALALLAWVQRDGSIVGDADVLGTPEEVISMHNISGYITGPSNYIVRQQNGCVATVRTGTSD